MSLDSAKNTLYHEIGHCFDKNHQYSNSQEFKGNHIDDDKYLSSIHLTEKQKSISPYILGLIEDYEKNVGDPTFDAKAAREKIFSEIFAESIKKILLKDSGIENFHKNKYEYINTIIN